MDGRVRAKQKRSLLAGKQKAKEEENRETRGATQGTSTRLHARYPFAPLNFTLAPSQAIDEKRLAEAAARVTVSWHCEQFTHDKQII